MDQSAVPHRDALPWLIQGGMGVAISGWPLARAVSRTGQLGVVSGTVIDNVFARRLQDSGVDDELRSVLDRFPDQSVVDDVIRQFGSVRRKESHPYKSFLMLTQRSPRRSVDLLVLASFVEVALAKNGHDGIVGINLLTKVQIPTAPTLYGAILAGVDYVLMGAGVPTHIPGALESLARAEAVNLPLSVTGAESDDPRATLHFDPSLYPSSTPLRRPKFLGIVSSHVLATALAKRSNGPVDGFVVERPSAGGHNAPPRGHFEIDPDGNPVYGERDEVNYATLVGLGLPFWIAGGITSRDHVRDALSVGATGVQVGTLFAYCRESGMDPDLRRRVIDLVLTGSVSVTTSLRASSTGYPFKVAAVSGTVSEPAVYDARTRKCDMGYLREAYLTADGSVGYRCAAEPVSAYVRKGGSAEATEGTTCLCNGLLATCGLGQVRADGRREPPIVTSGDCINEVRTMVVEHGEYSAAQVVAHLDAGARFASSTPAPVTEERSGVSATMPPHLSI
jgi:NAD(P)H-dependent flavin oxidoreductase YrpB (nitropropane dioxygenase family)